MGNTGLRTVRGRHFAEVHAHKSVVRLDKIGVDSERLLHVAHGGKMVPFARVCGGSVPEVDGGRRVERGRAVIQLDHDVEVLFGHLRVACLLGLLSLHPSKYLNFRASIVTSVHCSNLC